MKKTTPKRKKKTRVPRFPQVEKAIQDVAESAGPAFLAAPTILSLFWSSRLLHR